MSLNFDRDDTKSVDVGDIVDARFERAKIWTAIIFFNLRDMVADQTELFIKWQTGDNQQLIFRVNSGTPLRQLNLFHGQGLKITGGINVDLNTWYLAAAQCNGTGAANDLHVSLVTMGGTFLDDFLAGTSTSDVADLTLPIEIAGGTVAGQGTANDPMDGYCQYPAYIKRELSRVEILYYLRDPEGAALSFGKDTVFCLRMGKPNLNAIDIGPRSLRPRLRGVPDLGPEPLIPEYFPKVFGSRNLEIDVTDLDAFIYHQTAFRFRADDSPL